MSDDTLQLQGLVEEAAYRYLAVRTEENRETLRLAWVDFLEALRSDWRVRTAA